MVFKKHKKNIRKKTLVFLNHFNQNKYRFH